ncbi:MAG: pyridoxal-5'-phosphate-dependent protein subunit beta [Chloroflexi bacterium]|nr:pyridoxal-5'-phosphate-dependent protein subunit beta [Chloroflexota bacterium]
MYFECINCNTCVDADITMSVCADCSYPLTISHKGNLASQSASPTVTLGEGGTKVIHLSKVAKLVGISKIYAKLENCNPTGSFKDRGSAALISAIKSAGIKSIVEDSSGNAGASVAAYSAATGIEAHIFVPENAPKAKIDQILVYGATVHKIPGPRDNAEKQAKQFVVEKQLFYASHNISPHFLDGTKSFGREVVGGFGAEMPDHIIIPVGNGSLLISTHLVLKELRLSGHIEKLPKLYAIQSDAIKPIVRELNGIEWRFNPNKTTSADGIASTNPPRIKQIIQAIKESKGDSISVTEDSIKRYRKILAQSEGIFMEPTSAVAFAGLETLVKNETIDARESVLIPITGSGLKSTTPI